MDVRNLGEAGWQKEVGNQHGAPMNNCSAMNMLDSIKNSAHAAAIGVYKLSDNKRFWALNLAVLAIAQYLEPKASITTIALVSLPTVLMCGVKGIGDGIEALTRSPLYTRVKEEEQ